MTLSLGSFWKVEQEEEEEEEKEEKERASFLFCKYWLPLIASKCNSFKIIMKMYSPLPKLPVPVLPVLNWREEKVSNQWLCLRK